MDAFPFADLGLARRLEQCEGRANASFVEARSRLEPALGATWIECAGAFVLFDGPESPLTQTFALGITATPAHHDLERIEGFFAERGAATFHEVSPLAGIETFDLLAARGYSPVELSSVMYRPIRAGSDAPAGDLRTRQASPAEFELWADVASEGWREFAEIAPVIRGLARVSASSAGTATFFAEIDGRPVATGAVAIHGGVAILAGASTIPEARGRGAQSALLAARLRHAAESGCDLAMICAAPGSASQRNAERHGFRIAYTRVKWRLKRE